MFAFENDLWQFKDFFIQKKVYGRVMFNVKP